MRLLKFAQSLGLDLRCTKFYFKFCVYHWGFVFFHSQPYFGFSILINKMHFKLVSSFFYSAGETERGGLVSVWCNVLGQHKTFFVASPKKKSYSAVSQGKPEPPNYFILAVTLKKNSLITQRYAAIPQDKWPFVFVLFWVQWESSLLLHIIFSLFCLFICLFVFMWAHCYWYLPKPGPSVSQDTVKRGFVRPALHSLFDLNQQRKSCSRYFQS